MNITAANNRLHAEIDKLRYDKLSLKVASASTDRDIKAVVTESAELEKGIHSKNVQAEEVEHEIISLRQESETKMVSGLSKTSCACCLKLS